MGKVHAKISQGIRLTIPASSPDDMMLMGRKKSARAGCACCAAEARVAERGGPAAESSWHDGYLYCSIIRRSISSYSSYFRNAIVTREPTTTTVP